MTRVALIWNICLFSLIFFIALFYQPATATFTVLNSFVLMEFRDKRALLFFFFTPKLSFISHEKSLKVALLNF